MTSRPRPQSPARRCLGIAALAAWIAAAPAAAAGRVCGPDSLADFVGAWTAQGAFQRDPDAPREAVRCRIAFALTAPDRLTASGLCATTARKSQVGGWLGCDGPGFSGPFVTLEDAPVPAFLRDVSDDDEIALLLEAPHPETGAAERFRLRIRHQTAKLMTVRLTRGAWTALTLRYVRQDP